ncbi:MAG TPA: FAD-dependent oxidoreductase [Syntrophales bacterium]|nr:FAD-dependent oxidoreductase [Syntrophales bacterium]
MPYYIGDVIKESKRLVIRTPEEFKKTGIDARVRTNVEGIDAQKGLVYLSGGTSIPYDYLVMATGADAIRLDIPGKDLEGVHVIRDLMHALKIKSCLNEGGCKKAVLIGGGYIGMEMCEALRNVGVEVKVIDILPRPACRWDPEFTKMIVEELGKNQVEFMPETRPLAIEKGKSSRLKLSTSAGELDADMVLMGVGTRYNTALAQSMGIEMGQSGAIKVDFHQKTSRENVWAVGDCCEAFHRVARRWVYFPLGDIANKQGRVAGQNIGGSAVEFPGIVGAQAFKVFKLEVGATGLTEEEAVKYGFEPVSSLIWGLPIGRPMAQGEKLGIKLVGDKKTGKLLGGQCIGEKGAVQRISALSIALWSGLTVDELGYVDLPYAPPFGGAWDAIHIAAQDLARKL